jgi:ATP-binding cassette subfamily C exporter for protease/lipase
MTDSKPAAELRQALSALRGAFLGVGAFSACINLLLLAPAIYMLQVYDRVLSSHNELTLVMLSMILIGLYVLYAALEAVRSLVLVRVGVRLDQALDQRVFDASFERGLRGAGGTASQGLSDLQTLRQFLTGNGIFAFFDAPWAPIYLLVITAFHPLIGLVTLLGVLALVVLNWLTHRITHEPLTQAQKLSLQGSAQVNNSLRNAEVIEAMGMLGNLRRWV